MSFGGGLGDREDGVGAADTIEEATVSDGETNVLSSTLTLEEQAALTDGGPATEAFVDHAMEESLKRLKQYQHQHRRDPRIDRLARGRAYSAASETAPGIHVQVVTSASEALAAVGYRAALWGSQKLRGVADHLRERFGFR